MGRGGKKKGKKESEDIGGGLGLLSLEDQPSTSSAIATQEITKADPPPEKEAEPEGDGLSLLGVGGPRKPRKKKNNAPSQEAPKPLNPSQAAAGPGQPSPASQADEPSAGCGRGRGRGGAPPQAGRGRGAPVPVWGQSDPQVGATRQAAARPPGPWQAPQPMAPVPQSQSAPQISQAPRAVRPSTSQVPIEQQRPPSSKPTSVVCRFQLPKKIRARVPVPADATRVLTNYLPMSIKPLIIHRYDVAIKPDRPKKFMSRIFQAMKMKYYPKHIVAYDQMKNCYALKPLLKVTDERFETEVEIKDDNGKTCKYEIGLKLTGTVDLGTILSYMRDGTSLAPPTEAIHCIDVVLRQGALEKYVKASRQYFMRPKNPIDLGDGLEMWTGLFQSAIFTSRPFINIDVAHKGFPKSQPLVDTYINDFRLNANSPIEKQRKMECELFLKFIRGLRVVATIGDAKTGFRKREFICNDLKPPPNALKFTMQDDKGVRRNITVEQYFSEKGYRLRYPNINCVWVGPRDKEIYYPMELLHVSYGQALNRQLNDRQLAKMVREAATPPSDRKRKIEEVIRDMKYSSNEYFKEFGLEITNDFYQVDAKVLHAPVLNVGEGTIRPREGVWMQKKLLKPSALRSWGFLVVEIDPNRLQCHDIIKKIQGVGRQMGMLVQDPALTNFNVKAHELLTVFRRASDANVNFLFVIVSSWIRDLYQKVKKMAELEVGILTQCIKDQTAERRMNEQTIRNILLKVNSKLMGVNQTIGTASEPACLRSGGVMVVGADVTHPSPEQTDIPSIAAVTASFDTKCFQYNIELSIQTPKKEMIVEFENMMVEHLKVYKKHQNTLPKKIFIFRDGVSEGQFSQVMDSELVAVYRAYERLAGCNVKPEVLFLLVQKRHHTRFFLGANNAQNVRPGTVVDKDIVHNSEMDFYMVSHYAIKGTARPTRYYGVRNDGNIPIEEVEQLTYYLCHLYSRCTRSVSYPTPTYYAHLACTRAKHLTAGDRFNNRDLEMRPQRLQVLDRMLDFSRMFFV
ncbi:protein argonaute-2 [Pieris rapae]|uniref:protein argonaute-2 n=1 Tax=Pieris rapae TaxID=64459 RepID=UPI001E27B3FC|nr:protein argonaute-2 [Pieris rapae]